MTADSKRIAITGGFGFLGWHTACRLRALHQVEPVRLGREDFADPALLAAKLADVDAVIHIAGVNRADSDAAVEQGNIDLATTLSAALREIARPVDVVFANSIQAQLDNPYGRGKAEAARIVKEAAVELGGHFADLLLPNLFGEHGRPGYNSFVATFAHEVAAGRTPSVTGDREIELLHAQDAAAALIEALGSDVCEVVPAEAIAISEVLRFFLETHELYATRGEVPDISTPMRRNLFNTYRAAAFPDMWPVSPQVHGDNRGDLYETVRAHGGTGMAFMSTTLPGQKRGEHYHLHKVERFFVVKGEAEIELRRLLHDDVVSFRLSGDKPSFVDMPALWVHNIRNVGDSELITMFWADQLLDMDNPDQFPETIAQEATA
ncbi:NAD-dependent epimerase/dehydratase family protein [Nocardioides jishulii]|uniref:NAD-dependent epimerase/dehydratase family protein n=1 Tax=Nocardioides jishulii TaxID=2575440 RepID=A0A4U2YQT9_9ACTN|nr:NAD-dependent epimerase/dehydratase family protein [Nocardioides jishulii]QCX26476.1 NAD-dependent epimerase/dehydratase family protein [Nocardioides jishulii]TKI63718.1 NAD-dependent epimerase/dehydratase family protein [Nocardioides jishulii]